MAVDQARKGCTLTQVEHAGWGPSATDLGDVVALELQPAVGDRRQLRAEQHLAGGHPPQPRQRPRHGRHQGEPR